MMEKYIFESFMGLIMMSLVFAYAGCDGKSVGERAIKQGSVSYSEFNKKLHSE